MILKIKDNKLYNGSEYVGTVVNNTITFQHQPLARFVLNHSKLLKDRVKKGNGVDKMLEAENEIGSSLFDEKNNLFSMIETLEYSLEIERTENASLRKALKSETAPAAGTV